MFKLFRKKLNKKGFTLAELLVVVGVIAVLVAIAIPIFSGSLKDAQWRTNQANVRSVKAEAVTQILSHWGDEIGSSTPKDTVSKGATMGWKVTACVDGSGNISGMNITIPKTAIRKATAKIGTTNAATATSAEGQDTVDITTAGAKDIAITTTNKFYFVELELMPDTVVTFKQDT